MSEKTLFTGKTHNVSGRNGSTRSSDGFLDLKLAQPHPAAENLFGAAWSACFMGAIELAAAQRKVKLPTAPEDMSMISQWRRYSTLSPWRSIGTIVLLSLTSYLIAFIIASDTFRAILERLGWSSGTGL